MRASARGVASFYAFSASAAATTSEVDGSGKSFDVTDIASVNIASVIVAFSGTMSNGQGSWAAL